MIRALYLLASTASVAMAAGCVPGTNYEDGWRVHAVRVHHPFRYLSWLRTSLAPAFRAAADLEGKPFNNAAVSAVQQALEDGSRTSSLALRGLLVSAVGATECTADKNLDLVFTVVDLRLGSEAFYVLESREAEQDKPEETTGQVPPKQRFRLMPSAGYNAADKLFAGGALDVRQLGLHMEGFGSGRRRRLVATLQGSRDPERGRIGHAEGQLTFSNNSQPAADRHLGQGSLSAVGALTLRPTKNDWVYRFAGSLEGGFVQSNFAAAELDPFTVSGSSYGSIKAMAGISKATVHQGLAATYGLELGATGRHIGVDWVRHFATVTHDLWWPVANHRLLEFQTRVAIGAIQVPGTIPLGKRFFGGNSVPVFLPLPQWDVPTSPLIRGIPSYRLSRFQNGAGATSFQSINLTGAVTAWGKPLVPLEASQNPEIRTKLNGQLTSAQRVVKASVGSKDPAFLALVQRMKDLVGPFTQLSDRVAMLPESEDVTACADLVDDTADPLSRLHRSDASALTVWDSAGKLLTAEGGFKNYLAAVDASCVSKLKDSTVEEIGERLRKLAEPHRRTYEAIAKIAEMEAEAEIKPAKRIINTLMDDLNLVAVSPVAIFDAARIGGTSHYSTGGGVRFSLVSTVSFTIGWAWNLSRKPGDGPGAIFFSTEFKDLFH